LSVKIVLNIFLNNIIINKKGEIQMSKSTRNTGKPWSSGEVSNLKNLANHNTPTRVIGLKLGRTPGAVQTKASDLKVSLKPTNQSPYNKAKK
jgi:hypothetical protein